MPAPSVCVSYVVYNTFFPLFCNFCRRCYCCCTMILKLRSLYFFDSSMHMHSVHCGWAGDSLHALCTLSVQIFLQQFNSFICFHRIFSGSIQLSPFLLKHFTIQIHRILYFAHYQHGTVNISFWFSTNT